MPDWRYSSRRCTSAGPPGKSIVDRCAAAGDRLEFGECQRRQRKVGADQFRRRQYGKRIDDQWRPGAPTL